MRSLVSVIADESQAQSPPRKGSDCQFQLIKKKYADLHRLRKLLFYMWKENWSGSKAEPDWAICLLNKCALNY